MLTQTSSVSFASLNKVVENFFWRGARNSDHQLAQGEWEFKGGKGQSFNIFGIFGHVIDVIP